MADVVHDSLASATRLINLKTGNSYTKYIGRSHTTMQHFGNPFTVEVCGSNDEAKRRFDFWIRGIAYTHIESKRRVWIINNLSSLEGHVLACWCLPLPCHGEIYLQLLEERRNGKCLKV